ncbi:hypothetical protein KAR48_14960 [bacterium]|nr:hypothetical protein [bacterium]
MKRAVALVLLLVFAGLASGQTPFFKGDLKAARDAAKAEDKLIFVHFDSDG